jgi:hypothetical protein
MTTVLDLTPHQVKVPRVGNVQRRISTSALGQINSKLRALRPRQKTTSRVIRIQWLARDIDLSPRRSVLPRIRHQLPDLVVGGARVLKDADLDPDRRGFAAVLGGLLVELAPARLDFWVLVQDWITSPPVS